MFGIGRRAFITLLGASVALPRALPAQPSAIPVIGFLHHASPDVAEALRTAFQQGLKEAGFIDSQNVRIEYRWAEDRYDRLPELAADLVRREVAVIIANTSTMHAAKAATATIPIIFASADDPVGRGLVVSFNRPGGNATGIYFLIATLEAKRAELLHEVVPTAARTALLVDRIFPSAETQAREMEDAARSLGLDLLILKAGSTDGIDAALSTLVRERAGALAVAASGFFFFQRERLVALAAQHGLPVIYPWRDAAAAGGLMSYGASPFDAYRQAGIYIARILKGAKPAELPAQQSMGMRTLCPATRTPVTTS